MEDSNSSEDWAGQLFVSEWRLEVKIVLYGLILVTWNYVFFFCLSRGWPEGSLFDSYYTEM